MMRVETEFAFMLEAERRYFGAFETTQPVLIESGMHQERMIVNSGRESHEFLKTGFERVTSEQTFFADLEERESNAEKNFVAFVKERVEKPKGRLKREDIYKKTKEPGKNNALESQKLNSEGFHVGPKFGEFESEKRAHD